MAARHEGSQLVLSTGDPTGYSYHGDYMNGWDQPLLEKAIKECDNTGGELENCDLLRPLIQSQEKMGTCKKKIGREVDEDVHGPLDSLPGCNYIVDKGYPPKGGCSHEHGEKPKEEKEEKPKKEKKPKKVSSYADSEVVDSSEAAAVDGRDPYLVWVTETVYSTVQPGATPAPKLKKRHAHGIHHKH